MKTFLYIPNRIFIGTKIIFWLLSLFFAKFDVAWNTTQDEIFKIPQAMMNAIFLLWLMQKTIKAYKNNLLIFGILALFWVLVILNRVKFLLSYSSPLF